MKGRNMLMILLLMLTPIFMQAGDSGHQVPQLSQKDLVTRLLESKDPLDHITKKRRDDPCDPNFCTKIPSNYTSYFEELFYPHGPWNNPEAGNCLQKCCVAAYKSGYSCTTLRGSVAKTVITSSILTGGAGSCLAVLSFILNSICCPNAISDAAREELFFAGLKMTGGGFAGFFSSLILGSPCVDSCCSSCDECILEKLSDPTKWHTESEAAQQPYLLTDRNENEANPEDEL